MNDLKREFRGIWIAREIWLDKRLNALDKVILAEIDSLDNDETGCYASNEYLAEFCQCGITKVSTAIGKLIDHGYIYVAKFDGRTRILKSRLSKNERQTYENREADLRNSQGNNITNNPLNNNKECTAARFTKPTIEEIRAYCKERKNKINAQCFYDFYESKGWKVGNQLMKDWRACVRTWEARENDEKPEKTYTSEQLNGMFDNITVDDL
jgi:hypothetical protein